MNGLQELQQLGLALGGDAWVQGPGGNLSIKAGDRLLVKASGVRLRDVAAPSGHANVELKMAELALAGDAGADKALFAAAPRPSLETYFHAMGPRVVAHTHPVGVLLAACTQEVLLADLPYVPYQRPGRDLALAVQPHVAAAQSSVILLQSHGLLVYAQSVEEAVALSFAVDVRAREHFQIEIPFEDYLAAYMSNAHDSDTCSYRALPVPKHTVRGYLFPDVAVFGTQIHVAAIADDGAGFSRLMRDLGRPAVLSDDAGARFLVARTRSELDQATEVVAAHDWVYNAILNSGRSARFLPSSEIEKIVTLPSEQYRLALTQRTSSC